MTKKVKYRILLCLLRPVRYVLHALDCWLYRADWWLYRVECHAKAVLHGDTRSLPLE